MTPVRGRWMWAAAALLAAPAAAQAPPDTAATPVLRMEPARSPSPRGALARSFALPGWGQLYVGQPAKAPVVVAVVGGLATAAVFANGRYLDLRHAYLYVSREDADPAVPDADNEFARFFEAWQAAGGRPAATLRAERDGARRTRDLAVLGTTLAYVLQALDAYVAAHLTGFDVSEDLSLHLVPSPEGPAVAVAVRF